MIEHAIVDRLDRCRSRLAQWRQQSVMTEWSDPGLMHLVESLSAELERLSGRQHQASDATLEDAVKDLEEKLDDATAWFGLVAPSIPRRSLSFAGV